jgi:dCTP deaminase
MGSGWRSYDVRITCCDAVISPGQFMLAATIERFQMPDDLMGIVHDKSTWARRGLVVQNTVIAPGWHGYLTLELTNHGLDAL